MRSGGASAGSRSLGCVMIHFSAAGVSTESSIAVTPSSARAICGAGPAVAPFLRKRGGRHTVHSGGVADKWFEIHILVSGVSDARNPGDPSRQGFLCAPTPSGSHVGS